MTREEKEQLYYALWAKRRLQVKKSFYQFTLDAFEIVNKGAKLETNWHIEYLCNTLQREAERLFEGLPKTKDIIINVPPRTLKSTIVSICFPVWCWIHNPKLKFIGSSYSSTLSIDLNVMSRRLVESEWFQKMFGDEIILTSDQNTKSNFENSEGGFRKATSTGSSVTGTGGDVVMVDDPLDPLQANSKAEREEANTHFDTTLATRLNNQKTGFFIVIMQRLHQKDLTGHLISKEPDKWEHICLPAEDSNEVKPAELRTKYVNGLLFPARLNEQILESMKIRLGSYGYSGQFKQTPTDTAGGVIKKDWFRKITWQKFAEMLALDGKGVDNLKWNFYLDTAYTEDERNDPTAFLACAEHKNNLYIRNVTTKRLEFPELCKFTPEHVKANGYTVRSRIYIEPKASGKSTVQQLKSQTMLSVIEFEMLKGDKMVKASSVSPIIETGRVFLIEGGWNQPFLDEIGDFPKAEHDDQLDVLVMAVTKELIKKTGDLKATR